MKKFAVALTSFVTFVAGVIFSDTHSFHIVNYRFGTKGKISRDLKIVCLADLHDKKYVNYLTGKNLLLKKIDEINPDYIFLAGDMITARSNLKYENAIELITSLAKKYPVYYGMGNHEYRFKICSQRDELPNRQTDNISSDKTNNYFNYKYEVHYEEVMKRITATGAVLLDDQNCYIKEDNICIYGLTVEHDFYHKIGRAKMQKAYIDKKIGKSNHQNYNILLAHNPEDFEAYSSWGADLTFSGHIHGGMLRFPHLGGFISPRYVLFPRYDGGVYGIGKRRMVLSRGLGQHTLPIRIFNPGEVCVIHLKK